MRRFHGRHGVRHRAMARWNCVRYGIWGRWRHSPMNSREGDEQARSTAEAVARRSYGKLVAFLAARTHDVASAEDALSEAFAAALADWPRNGCPSNPAGWLLTVARRKTIDLARRRSPGAAATGQLQPLAD